MHLLIERYLARRRAELEHQLARARKAHDEVEIQATTVTWQHHEVAWQALEKILFADSALAMLFDTMHHVNEVDPVAFWQAVQLQSAWLEFSKAIQTGPLVIAALHFQQLYDKDIIEQTKRRLPPALHSGIDRIAEYQDIWSLDLIDRNGDPVFFLVYHPSEKWMFSLWHVCPSGHCQGEGQTLQPCDECQALRSWWGTALALCLLMRERYFAEEVVETVRYHDTKRVPRKENPKKFRTVDVAHVFRLIDASIRVLPILPEEPVQHRGSWLLAHTEEEIERKEQTVKRTYRHPRYINVRGTTQQVTRIVPVLREREEKRITKIIASTFE